MNKGKTNSNKLSVSHYCLKGSLIVLGDRVVIVVVVVIFPACIEKWYQTGVLVRCRIGTLWLGRGRVNLYWWM